jgi:hypothetical protein
VTPTASDELARELDTTARFESPAVGVERAIALGGALSLLWSLGILALVTGAVLHVVAVPVWAYVVLFLAPILIALGRRLLRGMSARRAPGAVSVDVSAITIDRAGVRRQLAFPPEREGWSTPLADGSAVVGLRVRGGGLVCFRIDQGEAARALAAAGVTPGRRPLRFTLERPGPWSLWLRWLQGKRWARAGLVTMLLALAALELAPALYPLAYLVGLALFVGERALWVRDPPRVVVEEGALGLAALGHRSRVPLDRVVSVDATPRGVVLTSADGGELVLPIASGRPERRGRTGFWVSEAELRDSELARQASLVEALKLACAALGEGQDGYRGAALRGYARAARLPPAKS